ncbi:hypothetical protein [Serratia aquatilis]|uniref:Uncharacterized protein n=1 Tax=Serratia aquatilis TaxID=1737515 RepID=A0ABV6EHJ5_9GAMM
MIKINVILEKIEKSSFFYNMGFSDIESENIILIKDVDRVFVNPSDIDFKGLYENVEWLPTSATQEDPFYKTQKNTKELTELRIKANKAVMSATRNLPRDKFICGPHDFSQAARNGICFSFRQYISERYLNLGNKWETIINIYYIGHWPVGYAKEKIIVI